MSQKKPPLTLEQAIENGDYLQILYAQRRDLTVSMASEKGQAKATMYRVLRDVCKEIQMLEIERDPTLNVAATTTDERGFLAAV